MEKIRPLLLLFVAATAAFLVGRRLFPIAHPYSSLRFPLDAEAITSKANEILRQSGVVPADMTVETKLKANAPLLRKALERFGRQRADSLITETLPGYYWEITFKKRKSLSLESFSTGRTEEEQQQAAREILDVIRGDINVRLDVNGKLLHYSKKIPDSTRIPSLTAEDAWKQAGEFLSHFIRHQEIARSESEGGAELAETGLLRIGRSDPLKFDNQKKIEQPHRTDYEFLWTTKSPELDDKIEVRVALAGSTVSSAKIEYIIPEDYAKKPLESTRGVVIAMVYVVLLIIMLIAAFKRIRASEIGFPTGVAIALVYTVTVCYHYFIEVPADSGWTLYIPLPFIALFGGGGVLLLWAVSESVVRETWKEKFVSLDLLRAGHVSHSYIGASIVRGLSFALLAFALWMALLWITQQFAPLWAGSYAEATLRYFAQPYAVLQAVTRALYTPVYPFICIFLFLVPYLRQRIASPWLLLPIPAAAFGLNNFLDMNPVPLGVLVYSLSCVVLVYALYRFDVLTAFIAVISFSIVNDADVLLASAHPTYTSSGYFLLGIGGLAMAWGFIAAGTKDTVVDFDSIAPAFARFISERQRLRQELVIARQVQMSFLPKANPRGYDLDIASRCSPALEVGGDYFDFIEMDKNRLGVAVGDVSGKGTQAAFFMTLTKGFLRALTNVSHSPADVLSQVNKLFYENVERGVFISLVYGVFDLEKRSLTVARAGHNPLIVCKTHLKKAETVSPLGLGLGLDKGDKFEKTIQEEKIAFRPGDLFVFYTDGFPEAMNKTKEQFGEERLLQTVEKLSDKPAKEILEGIFFEMKSFAGKAPQHDDMTIVVVKVP
jgi:serine phosphatase RsbU (regulator of sigma subunit)